MLKPQNSVKSRHNKIQYWFWNDDIIKNEKYLRDLDNIHDNSDFDTVVMTSRFGFDFWDKLHKMHFARCVDHAHKLGIKVLLQLWPRGYFNPAQVDLNEAAALVSESEGIVYEGKLTLNFRTGNKRWPEIAPGIKSELLGAYAFVKTGDGFYKKDSLVDITDMATIEKETADTLTISFDEPQLEGFTVYAMTAHYFSFADMFSDWFMHDYADIMDYYADTNFDGFVLDEFKNIVVLPEWQTDIFRERIYGKHFEKYYYEKTGNSLINTMFCMRYCPSGESAVRMAAINTYFDIYRESTRRNEKFIAEYALKICGNDAFIGLHNTYHNVLDSDEIWMTGCNWWEVPRKYAQTDEDITYPVRMGIACQCEESIIYDMYYGTEEEPFFEKAMRDAKFGCRIHYHAINGGHYGVDTGNKEFLRKLKTVEDKVELMNLFEPKGLPKMELLVVFGFPAQCNWYPNIEYRNCFDINGGLNILNRVDVLWKNGYFNALAPSDAIDDDRIILDSDGNFDYCGHKFQKMLYLYPQYAKTITIKKLDEFIKKSGRVAVVGELTRGFNGETIADEIIKSVTVPEDADIYTLRTMTL